MDPCRLGRRIVLHGGVRTVPVSRRKTIKRLRRAHVHVPRCLLVGSEDSGRAQCFKVREDAKQQSGVGASPKKRESVFVCAVGASIRSKLKETKQCRRRG